LVVNNHNVSVLCVQETKLFVISAFYLNAMLGNRFSSYDYLPAIGTCGSVLIACRSPEERCRSFHRGSFSLSVMIDFDQGHESCCFTGVYGPQADVDKVQFLDELRSIHSSISCPWLIAGDFN
jgi:hypothetical protein